MRRGCGEVLGRGVGECMWVSVQECGEVCWSVGRGLYEVGKCVEVWGSFGGGVKKCVGV